MNKSPVLNLRVRGPLACFTRPELKVERVSYPMMTPSAARGILQSVLWKPAIEWRVQRIKVLSEIKFTSFRRNEVNVKASAPIRSIIAGGGEAPVLYAEDNRAQRNTVALRDVDYVIEATFSLTSDAGADDNAYKFIDMFRRRVEKGQHFTPPCLGCREFAAEVMTCDDAPTPIDDSRDLGIMLLDIDYRPEGNRPVFFHARLEHGVLGVPSIASCLSTGGVC